MNFGTMDKQRKYVLIVAAVGAIAMFLPFIKIFLVSINGMHGNGVLVFLCFIGCGIIAFLGDQSRPLEKSMWMIALFISGIGALLMLINFLGSLDVLSVFGIGFYLALATSIILPLILYKYRSRDHTIKDGFDSFRDKLSDSGKTNKPDRDING